MRVEHASLGHWSVVGGRCGLGRSTAGAPVVCCSTSTLSCFFSNLGVELFDDHMENFDLLFHRSTRVTSGLNLPSSFLSSHSREVAFPCRMPSFFAFCNQISLLLSLDGDYLPHKDASL